MKQIKRYKVKCIDADKEIIIETFNIPCKDKFVICLNSDVEDLEKENDELRKYKQFHEKIKSQLKKDIEFCELEFGEELAEGELHMLREILKSIDAIEKELGI